MCTTLLVCSNIVNVTSSSLQICIANEATVKHILEINENATLIFSISFKHGLVHQNFVFIRQLSFTYSIKRLFSVLFDCQYALFKSTSSETSYLTPCNVPHEWFVLLHPALLVDLVYNIFSTSKSRYVISISNYSKIKSLENANNFRAGGSGKL